MRDQNYLRGLDRTEFAHRAAAIMVDLNGVHPFREGDGRTQRVFISELAQVVGYNLEFSVVSRERMIDASIVGNAKNDPSMMQRLFTEISDPQRVAALTKAIEALGQHGFAWNNHYIATAEPGYNVENLRLAGVAGEQFMARTKTIILIGQTRDLPELRPEQGKDFTLLPTSWDEERGDRYKFSAAELAEYQREGDAKAPENDREKDYER